MGQTGEGEVPELPEEMDHVGHGGVPSAQQSAWHVDSGQEIQEEHVALGL